MNGKCQGAIGHQCGMETLQLHLAQQLQCFGPLFGHRADGRIESNDILTDSYLFMFFLPTCQVRVVRFYESSSFSSSSPRQLVIVVGTGPQPGDLDLRQRQSGLNLNRRFPISVGNDLNSTARKKARKSVKRYAT